MKYKFTLRLIALLAFQSLISLPAFTEVKGPGWLLGQAKPVSPKESRAYYQARLLQKPAKPSPGGGIIIQGAADITPEISELARALHNDPKLIFDYVCNNVDYVPYFGSLKGATLTLLDGAGNDFDQASLLIALLRASGYTANYYHGLWFYNDILFAEWAGVTDWLFTDRKSVTDFAMHVFALGGIPQERYSDSSLLLERVCVKVNISGKDYYFDPLQKRRHSYKAKINLEQAIGYNRPDLLSAATSGATIGADSLQNLNQTNLNNKLTEYTTNFINTLRTQYPNSEVREIVGGRKISETHLTTYPTSAYYFYPETWTEIPSAYAATLRIQHQGIDQTLQIPEITAKRLSITYSDGSFAPELRLDGAIIATGNSTTKGNKYDLILTIDHPYVYLDGTYADQVATYKCVSGSTYAIISDFGNATTDNTLRKRQKELSQGLANGLSHTSEPVLGEALNIMGLSFLRQTRLIDRLAAEVTSTIYMRQHAIGVMAQEAAYYVDVKQAFMTGNTKIQGGPYGVAMETFFSSTAIGSGFEHAILEQLMGADNPAASTIKLIHLANSQGSKIFWVNSANFSSIQPQLQNYSSNSLTKIQNAISNGQTIILPANGNLTLNQWHGAGYASKYQATDDSKASLEMAIEGGYSGGFASIEAYVNPLSTYVEVDTIMPDISFKLDTQSLTSLEPVDLATGAYLYDNTDLSLGKKAPLGLEFHRSYNSSRADTKRSLGYGWQHNYDIFLSRVSSADPGLGLRTPVDAAAMITNLYIANDLMHNEDNLTGWVTMFLAHKWAVDNLIDNAISVNIGGQVTEYIKLPDGTYNNPPGITTQLLDNGNNTFSLKERFGTQIDFDANDRISSLRDIDNNTLSFTYTNDKLTRVQDAVGRYLTLSYSGDNLTLVTDSQDRSISFAYDASNNLVNYTDLAAKSWGYGYDSQHQMTTLTNPLNITTATNTYDTLGRVKTQVVPRQGQTATYNFYFSGFRNVEEDPYGKKTVYYLDEKGRTYIIEDALANKTTKTFDGQNHEITIKDARSNTTTFQYDANQNLTKTTDALGKVTNNTYDGQFRLTDTTDPLNHTTHFDYDTNHHLIQAINAENNTRGFSYYSDGNLETATDARLTRTTYTYDANSHLKTSQVASHPAITYNYDTLGQLLSLTDQEGATTNFTYDPRGLVLTRTDPLGKVTRFVYDDAGRLTSRTDRNNQTITYAYTPTDKIQTITYPDNSTATFTYNLHDKLTNMQDATGTTTYTYDELYRLKTITNPYNQIITYTYDAVGNVTKITYPDNKAITYTYDNLNRLKTVTNWLSKTATYTYDAAGRLTNLVNFNGTLTAYSYDNANRLTSLSNKTESSGTIISSYDYLLDPNGNRTRVTQTEQLVPVFPQANINYTYNTAKNRLLSAGSTNFAYDEEGQLTAKSANAYTFDYEHRLKTISADASAQFTYDTTGTRLQATRSGTTTRYVYDASGNLLCETDSANAITRYYIHGLGLLAMVTPAGESYTYHYNGIGSTVAITDASKAIVNKYFYTAFGEVTNQSETVAQPFKYVGQAGVMQEPNGFYYMRARYYDPEVQRFISEDPSGFEGGDTNLYAYVGGNPVNFNDPFGLCGENVSKGSWSDIALQGIGVALVGLTVDDATVIGVADDFLIPILITVGAGITIMEARKFGKPGSMENPLPIKGAPGPDYWETPQGKNQPPRPGREGWWIVWKIAEAISEIAEHFKK
jgi:RHS repeat-associated protein